ncbi:hypothetical protein ABZ478_19625 [Streptomyces sp. NPDC005706]|uniref:preATP grasp domain-containing protein n=1 Tax=Streptomyces sp. NPDC005706 TaxID=3157169 RepID=UPI0034066ACC
MRILLGNTIDDSIRVSRDTRSAAQRILWFAKPHDVVILPEAADEEFLQYVTSLTGVEAGSLRLRVPPPGRFAGRVLDPHSLTDAAFARDVAGDLAGVSEIFALWPSPYVARFSENLGLQDRLPGAAFMAQGGGELANSKACFRALAAGAGVLVPAGAVCHNATEAERAMAHLLRQSAGVVVKQSHNGSGNGNQIVLSRGEHDLGHAGARHLHPLAPGDVGIREYWAERWQWASAAGRFPVVLEEFVPGSISVYSEHRITNDGVTATGSGLLSYADRQLAVQSVPLRPREIGSDAHRALLEGGARLAEVYRAVGYRGHVSADALVDRCGQVWFTEMNAQVSGSLHLYDAIAQHLVDASAAPQRTVAEYDIPASWRISSVSHFLAAARQADILYDPATRLGVILSAPPTRSGEDTDGMFCIVYDSERNRDAMYRTLHRCFRSVTNGPSYEEGEAG